MEGSRLYLADGGNGLQVLNIGNPAAPSSLSAYSDCYPAAVQVLNNRAYVGNIAYPTAGLRILDVANPANPILLGSYIENGAVPNLHVIGTKAYLANEAKGVRVINVATPSSPYLVSSCDSYGAAYGLYVMTTNAFVGATGLRNLNLNTMLSMGWWSTNYNPLLTSVIYGIQVTNNRAYLAYGYNGLQVVNVSNPTNLVPLGGYLTSGYGYAYGVRLSGNLAFLASSDGVRVFDVANPASIVQLGSCTNFDARAVWPVGDKLYVAAGASGLRVFQLQGASGAAQCTAGSFQTSAYTLPGTTYVLQRSVGLPPVWCNVATNEGTGGIVTFTDPAPAELEGYYRISSWP